MSRDPGEPLPPRQPKPKPKPKASAQPNPASGPARPKPKPPLAEPGTADEAIGEPSTFRPAQARRGSGRSGPLDDRSVPATGGPTWTERLLFGSVSTAHLAQFCRQLAAYLHAGVDLLKALTSLEQQFARTALGPVIGRVQLSVRRGDDLAQAMGREPSAFDPLLLSMMRVAEARGGVPETLRLMARHYDARLRLMRQARSALIYPVIVVIVAAAVVALLTWFVLPILVDLLADLAGRNGGASLPLPTRFLMAFSGFVRRFGWWLVPLGTIGVVFALRRAYRTGPGKAAMDEAALHAPVLGQLLRKIDTARFARTLSALLDGGVDIGASLDLAADVVHLAPFRSALRAMRAAVMEGTELGAALRASGRFTPDVVAVVNSGEETGKLPETLDHLADDYEDQVTYMVKNLGSLIQPLIIIGLGGIVLFIILAVLLPYIAMIQNLAGS